jgi:hypothetical protein
MFHISRLAFLLRSWEVPGLYIRLSKVFLSHSRLMLDVWNCIALGYRLDNRGSRVRFPARAGNFSHHHRVQNGSGAHPASYPIGTRCSFPGSKAAEAPSWRPLTSIQFRGQRMSGAVPPLPQYSSMAWCLVKNTAQGQLDLYLSHMLPYSPFSFHSSLLNLCIWENILNPKDQSVIGVSSWLTISEMLFRSSDSSQCW